MNTITKISINENGAWAGTGKIRDGVIKAIKTGRDGRGRKIALTTDGQTFGVYVLAENYNGKVRGGIQKTWRYIEKGMTREAAEALFNRRNKAPSPRMKPRSARPSRAQTTRRGGNETLVG